MGDNFATCEGKCEENVAARVPKCKSYTKVAGTRSYLPGGAFPAANNKKCCVCQDGYEGFTEADVKVTDLKLYPIDNTDEANPECNIAKCKPKDFCAVKDGDNCVRCISGYRLNIPELTCVDACAATHYQATA